MLLTTAGLLVSTPASAEGTEPRDSPPREEAKDDDDTSTNIAVDFDFGAALDVPGSSTTGGGGAIRIGREWDLLLISLTPEVGGRLHSFGGSEPTRIYGGFLGGRFAVGKLVEPSIFAHVGVSRVTGLEDRTAPTLDGGVALDLTLLPLIDIGVHGAYNVMYPRGDGSSLDFVTLGAHAALVL